MNKCLSCVQRIDIAYTLEVILCQTLAKVSSRSWWQRVIQVIQMTDWEPDKVGARVLSIIKFAQDYVVSGVNQFDLNHDCLNT